MCRQGELRTNDDDKWIGLRWAYGHIFTRVAVAIWKYDRFLRAFAKGTKSVIVLLALTAVDSETITTKGRIPNIGVVQRQQDLPSEAKSRKRRKPSIIPKNLLERVNGFIFQATATSGGNGGSLAAMLHCLNSLTSSGVKAPTTECSTPLLLNSTMSPSFQSCAYTR